jgi:hypothetical protein
VDVQKLLATVPGLGEAVAGAESASEPSESDAEPEPVGDETE